MGLCRKSSVRFGMIEAMSSRGNTAPVGAQRGCADPHARSVRSLASARRAVPRPARTRRVDQREGLLRAERQPHDLPVDRHVGDRAGRDRGRHGGLGRDLRHRRAAGRARDPARRADPVRRGPRPARRGGDLRRALRPACACAARRAATTATRSRRSTSRCGISRRRQAGVPLSRRSAARASSAIPAYVSGLPKATLDERVELARDLAVARLPRHQVRGRRVARRRRRRDARVARGAGPRRRPDGRPALEVLRRDEALELARRRSRRSTPTSSRRRVASEDIDGLAEVAAQSPLPIAAGEEWRNVWEARMRLAARAARVRAARDGPHRRVAVPRDREARRRASRGG